MLIVEIVIQHLRHAVRVDEDYSSGCRQATKKICQSLFLDVWLCPNDLATFSLPSLTCGDMDDN